MKVILLEVKKEISYNELTKLYNVSLDLPDPYNVYSTHLFIKASLCWP